MTRTFSPVVDIQTRQLIWAVYYNGTYVGLSDAVQVAGSYSEKYSSDVRTVTF